LASILSPVEPYPPPTDSDRNDAAAALAVRAVVPFRVTPELFIVNVPPDAPKLIVEALVPILKLVVVAVKRLAVALAD
jgi:hypothetical protein